LFELPPKAKPCGGRKKKAAISGSFSKKGKNLPAVAAGLAVVLGAAACLSDYAAIICVEAIVFFH